MTVSNNDKLSLLWLKIAAFSVFLGRGWQHLAWDTPYTVLLWDEEWMGIPGNDWSYFVNELFSDRVVELFSIGIGIYFFILLAMILLIKSRLGFINKIYKIAILIGVLILLFLSFLYCKNKFFEIPQFLEYTIQWSSPLFLLYALKNGINDKLILWMKIALAITFSSHGLYALGIYPMPVHFMEMTMGIMNLDEDAASLFLNIAGIMDFVVSIMIFINRKWMKSAFVYMVLWAFLTAFARTVYLIDVDFSITNLSRGLPETIYRISHVCIPLFLFLKIREV